MKVGINHRLPRLNLSKSNLFRLLLVALVIVSLSLLGSIVVKKYIWIDYKVLHERAEQKIEQKDYESAKLLLLRAEKRGGSKDYTLYFDFADVSLYLNDTKSAKNYAEKALRLEGQEKDPKMRTKYNNDTLRMQHYYEGVFSGDTPIDTAPYTVPKSQSESLDFQG